MTAVRALVERHDLWARRQWRDVDTVALDGLVRASGVDRCRRGGQGAAILAVMLVPGVVRARADQEQQHDELHHRDRRRGPEIWSRKVQWPEAPDFTSVRQVTNVPVTDTMAWSPM